MAEHKIGLLGSYNNERSSKPKTGRDYSVEKYDVYKKENYKVVRARGKRRVDGGGGNYIEQTPEDQWY